MRSEACPVASVASITAMRFQPRRRAKRTVAGPTAVINGADEAKTYPFGCGVYAVERQKSTGPLTKSGAMPAHVAVCAAPMTIDGWPAMTWVAICTALATFDGW